MLWRQPLGPLPLGTATPWCQVNFHLGTPSLSVLRTLTSLIDMLLLLSLCACAHSATCSQGTCGLWPLILAHSYLSNTHSLHFVFSVVAGYVPGFWFQHHNERVLVVSGIRGVVLRGVRGIWGGQGPRLTLQNIKKIKKNLLKKWYYKTRFKNLIILQGEEIWQK